MLQSYELDSSNLQTSSVEVLLARLVMAYLWEPDRFNQKYRRSEFVNLHMK